MVLFFVMNSLDKKYVYCKVVSDCFIFVKCVY